MTRILRIYIGAYEGFEIYTNRDCYEYDQHLWLSATDKGGVMFITPILKLGYQFFEDALNKMFVEINDITTDDTFCEISARLATAHEATLAMEQERRGRTFTSSVPIYIPTHKEDESEHDSDYTGNVDKIARWDDTTLVST